MQPRSKRGVADALAKQAYMLKNYSVWEDDPPDFISSLTVNDIAIIREMKSLPCQKTILFLPNYLLIIGIVLKVDKFTPCKKQKY